MLVGSGSSAKKTRPNALAAPAGLKKESTMSLHHQSRSDYQRAYEFAGRLTPREAATLYALACIRGESLVAIVLRYMAVCERRGAR